MERDAELDLLQLQLRGAETLVGRGRLAEATGVWRKAAAAMSSTAGLGQRLERFRLLVALKDYKSAFDAAEEILDIDRSPNAIEVLRNPWNALLFSRLDLRRSMADDLRLLKRLAGFSSSPWAAYYCALLLVKLSRRRDPEHDRCLLSLGRFPKARYGWMLRETGRLLLERRDFDAAVTAFRAAALGSRPASWRPFAACAEAYLYAGRPRQAFTTMQRAVAAAPAREKGDAIAWQAELRLWIGDYSGCLELLDRAIPLGGQYGHCWRGAARLLLGQPRQALRDLDFCLMLLPRDREAYAWRGETRRVLGDYEGALEDLSAEPLDGVSESRWLWHDVNRSLTFAALGNFRAMRRDYEAVPASVRAFLSRKVGLDPRARLEPEQIKRVLEKGLELARGYRRPELYGQAVWMLGSSR